MGCALHYRGKDGFRFGLIPQNKYMNGLAFVHYRLLQNIYSMPGILVCFLFHHTHTKIQF